MMSALRQLSTDEILRRLGCLAAVRRKTVVLFGGEQAVREMLAPPLGWKSMDLGKNNEPYLLAPKTKVPGPEELRRSLRASFYACASEPCRMMRNPESHPRGLYIVRDIGPTGWCYQPDDFASPQTVARSVERKFQALRSEEHTKQLLASRQLRIEVVCLWHHKAKLAAAAVRQTNEHLLLVADFFALENLSWPS
jgi:hypothetical protein